jgi:uncharacterized protein (DUF58 family)
MSQALGDVFDPGFLRKLDRLRLTIRQALSTRPGNTPMPRGAQGSGIELEGYKVYHPGDDLRHLDWNAYSRLDEMMIKTFRAEREAPLHVFVDVSASMAAPEGDGKLEFALQLAAALAYVALRNHDPVRIAALSDALPDHCLSSPVWRHRNSISALRDFLNRLKAQGQTALASGMHSALRIQKTPGLAVLLSDFLVQPSAYETVLADLTARRFTVTAIRILGPAERNPSTLFRKARVLDSEDGKQRYITLDAENLARYENALAQHLSHLQSFCTRCGVVSVIADAGAGIERCVFHDLTAAGVLH